MRGYCAIGAEGTSKPMNIGALMRTAHAFGASFCFTVGAATDRVAHGEPVRFGPSDTSGAAGAVPMYAFPDAASLRLPDGCILVGIELMDGSIDLPSFRHPRQAAYVVGSERGGLSADLVARCAYVVRIPTRFSLNLSLAGALVLYDRLISLDRFAGRPLLPGGPDDRVPAHIHGRPRFSRKPVDSR
jgi:tRNA G18 (ribose-2'-O)-methylase SpoU